MTRALLIPALLVVLAVSASGQEADADRDNKDQAFKDGLDALDKGNWPQAASLFRKATAARGTESSEKVKKGFAARIRLSGGTEYLPHYFLGEALWKQDNCAGAMDAWWRSEQQGVVQKSERAASMREGYAACEKKGHVRSPRLEQVASATADDISKAAAAVDSVWVRVKSTGDVIGTERRAQLDEASALIREARAKLESARKTRLASELMDADATVRRAGASVIAVSAAIDGIVTDRAAAAKELLDLGRAIDDAAGIDGAIEPKRAFLTEVIGARRQQGRDALVRARRHAETANATPGGNPASLAEGRREAGNASRQLQQVFDEVQELERRDRVARSTSEQRLARQKFTFLDKGFKSFDSRASTRKDADPKLLADRRTLERRARTALGRLDAAAKAGDSPAIQAAGKTAEQIGAELERLNLTFGPLTIVDRGVPAALAEAADRFFSANFEGALEALAPEGGFPPDTPLLEHVYLMRAAARYELSLRSGGSGTAHLDEARAALVDLRGLNPAFEPDRRYFSPKFVAFFRTSRGAGQAVANTPAPAVTP